MSNCMEQTKSSIELIDIYMPKTCLMSLPSADSIYRHDFYINLRLQSPQFLGTPVYPIAKHRKGDQNFRQRTAK